MTAIPAAAETTYAASMTSHPNLDCNWMGQPINRTTLCGNATAYGPSS
jgi:hypothetical protein